MPDTFATEEPAMSTAMRVTGINGEQIDTSAYARVVMLDVMEGPDQIDVHLSVGAALALVHQLDAAIKAACLLASSETTTVRRIPIGTAPPAGSVLAGLRGENEHG